MLNLAVRKEPAKRLKVNGHLNNARADKTDLYGILCCGFIREIVYPFHFPLTFDKCKTLYMETCMRFCADFQPRPAVIPREKHKKVYLGQPIICPGKRQAVITSRLLVVQDNVQ
jgi:hypothetical protein